MSLVFNCNLRCRGSVNKTTEYKPFESAIAAAGVPLHGQDARLKRMNPHCLVLRIGIKAVGPLVAYNL